MRRLWVVVAVWVAFWALYPTFGRPRAFAVAIRAGARELGACDPVQEEKARQACWQAAGEKQQRSFEAITLRSEYAGYAPVGFGTGLGVPLILALCLAAARRRRLQV